VWWSIVDLGGGVECVGVALLCRGYYVGVIRCLFVGLVRERW
jgi:hypothetical protein